MNRRKKAMIPHILTVIEDIEAIFSCKITQQKYFTFNFNCQQNIKKYTIIFPYTLKQQL